MQVRRSLTIKQMATVSSVALVTICIFIVIQLFHFVQQRRDDYAQQLESIAHSVRQPLADAVLRMDVPETESVLNSLLPVGILTRAYIVLPNEFEAVHANFPPERPVPALLARIFELPVQISVPLYSLDRANPQPLAYLVLQADSFRMYQFILSTMSTLLSTYLLLALILSVAITWCMNRLLVYPLRAMASELENVSLEEMPYHQLTLSARHQDDELGLLVRNYNRNQQMLAHREGTNPTLLFEPSLTEKTQKKPVQENEILLAIEQRRFTLFLQPQVDMQTHQVLGAEALLRWQQHDGSLVLPANVIPLAEALGVIVPLGNWVLEESCRILEQWQNQGITLPLAVNVSALQMQHKGFVPHLKQRLVQHQIEPGKLLLEITETVRINDLEHVLGALRELHDLGVSVVLDDFGMGYSSLNYLNHLKCLPIDLIKIDKSFIDGLPEDDAIVRIISSISDVLDLPMMAEGVETNAQRDWLLQHGIRHGQGFLFAEPLPREAFEARFCSPVR